MERGANYGMTDILALHRDSRPACGRQAEAGARLITAGAVLCALALQAAVPAAARQEAASAQARAAQFVLVIDDSGSMRTTDPDRLAVFAARALLSILDDRDEVSVVRLNAAADREAVPPIEPLARNRQRLQGLLDLRGRLAAYDGRNTTCRSALAAVERLLEAAYRPNVAQVVLFLTDGKCTGADEEPAPAAFLGGLRSHGEELFQLYLLRFRGEQVSPELVTLAERSGGETLEIGAADPTAILHGFATALSRSQGYEAELLTPADAEVAAHRGAKRVRLLGVARGEQPPLGLAVHDYQGRQALALGQARPGVHRFERKNPFRYVALDYRPGTEPVTVKVTGAGDDWEVVAVPEYRLTLGMKAHEGACGAGGSPVQGGVETGGTACMVLELVNEAGVVVSGDGLGDQLEAFVRMRRANEPSESAVDLPAEPVAGQARFHLQRDRMEAGEWLMQPFVRLGFGVASTLRGRSRLLNVASSTATTSPDRLGFDRVRPGGEVTQYLSVGGNFQTTPAHLELPARKDVPSCVTFDLAGKREGTPQPVTAGQRYAVTLRVAGYCGPESLELPVATRLRLVFSPPPGARYLPAAEVPVDFILDYLITPPKEVVLRLRGGETAEVTVPIGGNRRKDVALEATLAPTAAAVGWPGDDLALAFAGAGSRGEPGAAQLFTLPRAGGAPLRLTAAAVRCCAAGTYTTHLGLVPADRTAYARGAEPPAPLVVPVRVEVASAGFAACWLPRILWTLLALLLVALVVYVVSMFRHSRFLSSDRVAEKLVPLAWTRSGGTTEQKNAREPVLQMVRRGMRWPARARAWLAANPLAFGLRGGAYRETLELDLQPQRDNSSVGLRALRNFPDLVKRDPKGYPGQLFAVAHGSVSFLGVPDPGHRICQMTLDGAPRPFRKPGAGPDQPEVMTLRGQRLLRRPETHERREGLPAGWRVG